MQVDDLAAAGGDAGEDAEGLVSRAERQEATHVRVEGGGGAGGGGRGGGGGGVGRSPEAGSGGEELGSEI